MSVSQSVDQSDNILKASRPTFDVLRGMLGRWETVLVFLIVLAAAWSANISPFFVQQNFLELLKPFVAIGLMSLGLALVMITGEIDISVTSILALSTVVFAMCWREGVPLVLSATIAVLAGAILGLFNGVLVGVFKLPSLAVTLGTQVAYRGIAFVMLTTEGVTGFPDSFTRIGFGRLGSTAIPIAVIVLAVFALLYMLLVHVTRFGRNVFIIGSNQEAARFSGIPVKRIKVSAFVLSGTMAAVAGLIYASFFNTVRADIANEDLLDVVTAVVLGGVDPFGGSGTITGVLLALILIVTVRKGMGLANISSPVQGIVIGILLVAAILIGNLLKRRVRYQKSRTSETETIVSSLKEVEID